jgi:ferredoxin-thioredoxin reductase catalytic subunit
MPCTYCLSFVLYLLIIVHRYALYILFVLRSLKERRTNNMYKACPCTMVRRQRTKNRQYVQGIPMYNGQKIKNEGQTICTRHTYVQWSEDKERRTNNMYKAYIGMPCTYCLSFVLCLLTIVHRHALYILFVLRSLSSDHCT